ncbi:MAG: DUF302 domain-containing protein [Lentisphaerae bacterium]|nr:DUF302 domain-containing protein [Lentisphaerota bacterium]
MRSFLIGLVTGALAVAVVVVVAAPGLMLREQASPFGLNETVAAITNKVVAGGWVVSSVMPLDESVKKHGGDAGRPVRLINICQARHASAILQDDRARVASVLMPCTIAVYETAGGVKIGSMNAGLMGRFFGGTIARIMAGPVASEQAAFLDLSR